MFEVYKKKLFNIVNSNPIQNGVVYLDRADDFTLEFQNRRKNISSVVIGAFFIPFVLLGKGASYFLVLGISQYYSTHAFILASILVPGTLFFIIEMTIPSISLWKLKYSIEKEQ